MKMEPGTAIVAPNLNFPWLEHGFGVRNSVPPPNLTTAQQVHSARVLDACGRKGERIGEGDAIISAEPGVAIGIRTADCVPILLADPVTRIVACVHAGWRGTAANIIGATVDALRSRGCRPEDIHVAIGPSIGSCCYEVGADVLQHFAAWRSCDDHVTERRSGEDRSSLKLDLKSINGRQLFDAGVRQVWKSEECTFCNAELFFSFRREKERAGRMLSFVNRLA